MSGGFMVMKILRKSNYLIIPKFALLLYAKYYFLIFIFILSLNMPWTSPVILTCISTVVR